MNRIWACPDWQRVVLEALVLGLLAAAVGLSVNYKTVVKAFSGKTVAVADHAEIMPKQSESASSAEELLPLPVALDELDDFIAAGAVVIDARNRAAYEKGHVAGALSLPLGELQQRYPEFSRHVGPEQTLILYCSGFGCPDSFELGVALLRSGYQDVLVYEGGFPEWRDAGRPVVAGGQP